jgi:hypothetical protein
VVIASWTSGSIEGTGNYLDRDVTPGDSYVYHLEGWTGGYAIASEEVRVTPEHLKNYRTALLPNAPNPFNASTQLRFTLEEAGAVTLRIYDITGRLVVEMKEDQLPRGENAVTWRGLDRNGNVVSSGVYLVELIADRTTDRRRIALLK